MYDNILDSYKQAQTLLQGFMSNHLVLNDAVFPHWISGSECFWYKRETREFGEYRLVNARLKTNQLAFDHQALADSLALVSGRKIDHLELPITEVEIQLLPKHIRFAAFHKHWVFNQDKNTCEELKIKHIDGLVSPDGKKNVFVRDYNLWICDLSSKEERPLTLDGTIDYGYAVAPSHYGAPFTQELQAVWSPDSRRLFTHQLDIRRVATTPFVHHVPEDGSYRPHLREVKIAYPGDADIETYRLVVIDIESGVIQAADYGSLPLCRFGAGFFSDEKLGWWCKDNRHAFFIDVVRGAKTARVVEFDSDTGETRVLIEEISDTFVKLSHSVLERPVFLPLFESNELIWFSERTGWAHLYLYDLLTGELKHSVTRGKWVVRSLLHFDAKRREIIVQTAGRDHDINPYYRDICRVNIDSGDLTPLLSSECDHGVFESDSYHVKMRYLHSLDGKDVSGISPCGSYLVATRSRADKIPSSLLVDRDGQELMTVELAELVGLPDNWQWPEPFKLKGADGITDLYGVIYRPPNFSPKKSYPVLDFSCSHPGYSFVPHASFTNDHFCGEAYLTGASYAALGFVVVAIDVPGMPYRDKSFQDISYGNMVSCNSFADRIFILQQLANWYPYLDIDRVGLVSGGSVTGPVYGMLKHPNFYKVAVMAALEDVRFTPAAWGEMFEGVSTSQDEKYFAEDMVSRLQGKLLLIHGMLDTSTPATAVMRLIDALQRDNKDFDMLLLPVDGHPISEYAQRRSWDYLVTHLLGVNPPKEFNLSLE